MHLIVPFSPNPDSATNSKSLNDDPHRSSKLSATVIVGIAPSRRLLIRPVPEKSGDTGERESGGLGSISGAKSASVGDNDVPASVKDVDIGLSEMHALDVLYSLHDKLDPIAKPLRSGEVDIITESARSFRRSRGSGVPPRDGHALKGGDGPSSPKADP